MKKTGLILTVLCGFLFTNSVSATSSHVDKLVRVLVVASVGYVGTLAADYNGTVSKHYRKAKSGLKECHISAKKFIQEKTRAMMEAVK